MEYADSLWDGCTDTESDHLESVQYEAAKVVTDAMKGTSRRNLMQEIGWKYMKTRRSIHKLTLYFKIVKNLVPNYLKDLLPSRVFERSHYSLRNFSDYSLFVARTERFKKSFFHLRLNCGTIDVRNIESIDLFKKALFSIFHIPKYKSLFNFSLDRYSSIIHTRLRLDSCALNFYHPLHVYVDLNMKALIIIFYIVRYLLPLDRGYSPLTLKSLRTDGWLCLNYK